MWANFSLKRNIYFFSQKTEESFFIFWAPDHYIFWKGGKRNANRHFEQYVGSLIYSNNPFNNMKPTWFLSNWTWETRVCEDDHSLHKNCDLSFYFITVLTLDIDEAPKYDFLLISKHNFKIPLFVIKCSCLLF